MAENCTSLYSVSFGRSWQCDLTEQVFIEFKDWFFAVSVAELRRIKNRIVSLDFKGMLFDLSDDCDFHAFDIPQFQTQLRLSLCELCQLKDLVEGSWFAIELIHLCHEVLGDYKVVEA